MQRSARRETSGDRMAASGQQRAVGSAWSRPPRKGRSSATISREDIVAAAIEILRAEGYHEVSMRRVAAACGVGVTTLYWHVADKEELFDLVCDAALAPLAAQLSTRGGWETRLRGVLRGLRRALLSHGDLALIFASRPNVGPNALRVREHIAACLAEAGLTPTQARSVDRMLLSYTLGACCEEVAAACAAADQGTSPRGRDGRIGEFLAQLPEQDYPQLVRLGARSRYVERERDFLTGLTCFLAGLPQIYAR
jgi:AcrR family transcriptional regulator